MIVIRLLCLVCVDLSTHEVKSRSTELVLGRFPGLRCSISCSKGLHDSNCDWIGIHCDRVRDVVDLGINPAAHGRKVTHGLCNHPSDCRV